MNFNGLGDTLTDAVYESQESDLFAPSGLHRDVMTVWTVYVDALDFCVELYDTGDQEDKSEALKMLQNLMRPLDYFDYFMFIKYRKDPFIVKSFADIFRKTNHDVMDEFNKIVEEFNLVDLSTVVSQPMILVMAYNSSVKLVTGSEERFIDPNGLDHLRRLIPLVQEFNRQKLNVVQGF